MSQNVVILLEMAIQLKEVHSQESEYRVDICHITRETYRWNTCFGNMVLDPAEWYVIGCYYCVSFRDISIYCTILHCENMR
jgi:hypothetical protein